MGSVEEGKRRHFFLAHYLLTYSPYCTRLQGSIVTPSSYFYGSGFGSRVLEFWSRILHGLSIKLPNVLSIYGYLCEEEKKLDKILALVLVFGTFL